MSESSLQLKRILQKEAALFLGLLFVGIVLLPVAIYLVGQPVFGEYGGHGFADFFASLHYELRAGQKVTWYLVLSPYLCWQLLRLTVYAFRKYRDPASLTGR